MSLTPMDLVNNAKQQIIEIDLATTQQSLATDLILDVREPAEYAAGCLANAINIPRGVLEFKIGGHPDFQQPTAKIIVYCQSGGRSALAAEALNKLGYSNAVSMAGGFKSWTDNSLPITLPHDRT